MGKLLEEMVGENGLSENQFGFRKGRSIIRHLLFNHRFVRHRFVLILSYRILTSSAAYRTSASSVKTMMLVPAGRFYGEQSVGWIADA